MTKILIVEDNEMNRDMLSRRLLRRGYDIEMAVDGQEGIEKAKSLKPDLILMDMSLPVVDGLEASRCICSDPETSHIPIIALTAHSQEEDRQKALEAGCVDFDTKPIEIDRLLDKMMKVLEK